MPSPLYGVASFLASDSKILIIGGFNTSTGNSDKVYTIDLSNGQLNYLENICKGVWTAMTPFYLNNTLYIISTGEETDEEMPNFYKYHVKIPLS